VKARFLLGTPDGLEPAANAANVGIRLAPGDTFGHISVLSGLPPTLAVRAAEDTLLYRLLTPDRWSTTRSGCASGTTALPAGCLDVQLPEVDPAAAVDRALAEPVPQFRTGKLGAG
jgi:hypothetical protein